MKTIITVYKSYNHQELQKKEKHSYQIV